jgi:hypothetical protein
MLPSENGGGSTQELFDSEGAIIYHNSENKNDY